jgi:phage terminase large subunit-like protein
MANDSPDLAAMLDIGKYNIAHLESGSFFRAVSSEHRSKSGPRPSLVLIDEEHEHRDGTVIAKMVAGFKGRAQPLALRITNSGSDKTSICWQHHEHSLNVLEGSLADEQWFAYACQLDPCETCYAEGYREPKDGCPDCDDWTDPKVWPKTNPSLTIGLPRHTYLQSQVDAATAMPGEQALVKRLNFCIWTQVHTLWIPADRWEACRVPDVGSCLDGARAAAFDMSEKLDLTACVVGIKVAAPEDEPVQTIDITDIEGDDLIHKSFEMNFYVDLIPYFWLPEDTLRERVTKERIPFDVWSQTCCRCGLHMREHGRLDHRFDPCLRVTPGPVIDYDQIYAEFTQDIGKRFQPSRVGYDPHNATQFMVQLRDKAKYTVVEVAQGRKLSESFKLFQALAALKRIRHAGNPVMSWCVSNAEKKTDRYENIWCEKNSPTKRIDGVIAAVMVLNQLMLLPFKSTKRRRGQAKVWTPEGFKSMDSSTNTGVPSHA